MNTVDPFARRGSISHSPPGRSRAMSVPEVEFLSPPEKEGNPAKRKRNEPKTPFVETETDELGNLIRNLVSRARDLDRCLKLSPNTKMDIKRAGLDIFQMALKLQRLGKGMKPDNSGCRKIDSGNQTDGMEKRMVDVGTQADSDEIMTETDESERKQAVTIRNVLNNGSTFEDIAHLLDTEWPDRTFEAVKLETASISKISLDCDFAVIADPKNRQKNSLLNKISERHPEIISVMEGDTDDGQIEHLVKTTKITSRKAVSEERQQYIYALPFNIDRNQVNDMKKVWDLLLRYKDSLKDEGRTAALVIADDALNKQYLRKILEYAFKNTGMQITLLATDDRMVRAGQDSRQAAAVRRPANKPNRPVREAVIVRANGKTYSDLVKGLRDHINLDNTGIEISKMRKTQGGDVLLEIKKGEANMLKTTIANQIEGIQVATTVKEDIVHIKGMDSITTKEDVLTAVKNALGDTMRSCRVTSLRPAFGNSQNATVVMDRLAAAKLVAMKTVRIGLIHCLVLLRQREFGKCYKCWQTDHKAHDCRGPNRSNLCLKCAQPGHRYRQCRSDPYCPLCEATGHQAGSQLCNRERARRGASTQSNL
nr:unnamed protein product [Callosobruchus analis]CAI5849635.1 unnamed protein product [Callosobruchus analis]CAI5861885.1 unnamed protein product [Callosobruchus analis]